MDITRYGYWPHSRVMWGDIKATAEEGVDYALVPLPCKACGGEHIPYLLEKYPILSDGPLFYRFEILAGECPSEGTEETEETEKIDEEIEVF